MNDDTGKQDFFRRQRRNLIGVSIITTFYEAAGLEIKNVNLFGNHIEIKNPEIVTTAISIAFVYLLWRYYTACREIEGISRYLMACEMWANERCQAYVNRKYVDPQREVYESADLIQRDSNGLTFKLRLRQRGTPSDEKILVRGWYWFYRAVAFIPVSLQTSNFTEYLLPYLISLIAGLELLGFGVSNHLL